jgi:hypothetical protein
VFFIHLYIQNLKIPPKSFRQPEGWLPKEKMVNTKSTREKQNIAGDDFFSKSSKKTSSAPVSGHSNTFLLKPSLKNSDGEIKNQHKASARNKWRSQKYSVKSKLDNWKFQRKNYMFHKYRKEQNRAQNAGIQFDVKKIYDEEKNELTEHGDSEGGIEDFRTKAFVKQSERILQSKEEKEQRKFELLKMKVEREASKKKSKKERLEKYKKLNRKTIKGQPVMKGRMEHLLEKIQKSINE